MSSGDDSSALPPESARLLVSEKTINFRYKDDKLDMEQSNWESWSIAIRADLDTVELGSHITDDPLKLSVPPPPSSHPISYRNWQNNDRAVRGYIISNISFADCELIEGLSTARECWEKLRTHHVDERPIRQVNLIQKALATRIIRDGNQLSKARQIREDIRRAYRMPRGITEDILIQIAILNALVPGAHDLTHAFILRDILASTTSALYTSDKILQLIEQDLQLFLWDEQRSSSEQALALLASQKPAAQGGGSNGRPSGKRERDICTNCRGVGHSQPYCVHKGGGFEGKTIKEATAAKRAAKGNGQIRHLPLGRLLTS
ncbi:hypothetical protein D9613_010539 [Agrocybe pediades]|uniref:Uncharacterized protein n=1 Tax=Agrocybe pediades TaxID=84607 RepID=A0A8H4VJL1_9AGAR|nr:hypothetical protein D9613_010539 [Agrocybe pediades]